MSTSDPIEAVTNVLQCRLPWSQAEGCANDLAAAGLLRSAADQAVALQRRCFDECETAGWDPAKANTFAEEIAHLHEEVSEAFREWRLHKDFEIRYGDDGKPTGIPIELSDVLIGLFYNAELHGFDLLEAFEIKHQWNLTRSYADEGRQLHPADPPTIRSPREQLEHLHRLATTDVSLDRLREMYGIEATDVEGVFDGLERYDAHMQRTVEGLQQKVEALNAELADYRRWEGEILPR